MIKIKRKTLCLEEKDRIIIKTRLSKSSIGYYFNVSKCGAIQPGKVYYITVVSEDGRELVSFEAPIVYLKGIGIVTSPLKEIKYFIAKGVLEKGRK
ncbi:MAG: hypothetical protein QW615_05555, partial [Desulfurococcaceae archaeon]